MESISTYIINYVTQNHPPGHLIPPIKSESDRDQSDETINHQPLPAVELNSSYQQQLLRTVLDAIPDIIFVKNWHGQYILANKALAQFYGTTVDQILGKTDADFNPNHYQTQLLLQIDRQVIMTRTPKHTEAEPVRRFDGEVRWFQNTKIPILSSNGHAYHVLGIATDITKRHEAERMLWLQAEREHLLRNISQQIYQRFTLKKIFAETVAQLQQILTSDRVLLYRPEGNHHYQLMAEEITPQWPLLDSEQLIDPWLTQILQEIVTPPMATFYKIDNTETVSLPETTQTWIDRQQVKSLLILPILCQEEMAELCSTSELSVCNSSTCQSNQLHQIWGFLIAHQCDHPRHCLTDEIELLQSLATPIAIAIQQGELNAQLQATNHQLQQLAHCDGLTGLANRYRFDQYLRQEWKRLMRESQPLSLLLLDVDFFKDYNDTYGHVVGDQCLKTIAQVLRNSVKRSTDLVARYGGEEFAVILPNTPLSGAKVVAEEIQQNLKAVHVEHKASTVSEFLTLSIGVSSWVPQQNTTAQILVQTADQALYQAKQTGRDRVVVFDQS